MHTVLYTPDPNNEFDYEIKGLQFKSIFTAKKSHILVRPHYVIKLVRSQ